MKQINKRIKNAIVQGFVFNIVIFVIFLGTLGGYVYPTYTELEEKKAELLTTLNTLKETEKSGITYAEFNIRAQKQSEGDIFTKNLLKNLTESFYATHLMNVDYASFDEFLRNKKSEVDEKKSSDEFKNRQLLLADILPSYGNNVSISDSSDFEFDSLSDFEFVSYVESLLRTFNLISSDTIGIKSVKPVVFTESDDDEDKNNLDSNIYMIPLSLNVVGQKTDIIDFVHFIENVGSISIESGEIQLYSDATLKGKILPGDKFNSNYNIYKNQLIDIETVSMKSYLDASPEPVKQDDLVSFVKRTQPREKFEAELFLRFYVTGLPDYQIETFINQVVEKKKVITQKVLKSVKKYGESVKNSDTGEVISAINELSSLKILLDSMNDDIKKLKVDLQKKQTNIEKLFQSAIEFDQKLQQIEKHYDKNIKILETLQ